VERELLCHLQDKALFMPRQPELLLTLKREADKYLRDYDISDCDPEELLAMKARCVAAAMNVPEFEQQARQHLKGGLKNVEMHKATALVREGRVGRIGWFGKVAKLPKSE
jgi:hypothetical protein